MISKQKIKDIVSRSYSEVLERECPRDLNIPFTGFNSNIESIDIVQIISQIEDLLEIENVSGYDLLEKVFEFEELTFEGLIKLIENDFLK